MTHYLLAVHGPAEMGDFGKYGSKEDTEEAFAATGAFNETLRGDDRRPLPRDQGNDRGFWVIDAPDLDVALKLAAEGSRVCRGRVEVRPFDGLA